MKKLIFSISVALTLLGAVSIQSCGGDKDANVVPDSLAAYSDVYTFHMDSSKVTRQHVTYKTHFGFTISADLYMPIDLDTTKKSLAVLIGSPYGGVKQQASGFYAAELAKRGCVALAFDHSFCGESSGEPRGNGSYEIFSEDYSAGIDYLGSLSFVDREKIGVIGLGSSASFALNAAKTDKRMKALVSINLIDLARVCRYGVMDQLKEDGYRILKLDSIKKQRWIDVDAGKCATSEAVTQAADSTPAGMDPAKAQLFSYYGTKRGFHPLANCAFVTTSGASFINYNFMEHLNEINVPVVFFAGEASFSAYMSIDAFTACSDPKVIHTIPGAMQADLYDNPDFIPFDGICDYFKGMK